MEKEWKKFSPTCSIITVERVDWSLVECNINLLVKEIDDCYDTQL